MEFTAIPTEQTTSVTDLLLATIAAILSVTLWFKKHSSNRGKTLLWTMVFAFLSLSAFLGAIAHGILLPAGFDEFIWHLINFCLAVVVSLFVVAVILDLIRSKIPAILFIIVLMSGIAFFLITVVIPGSFLIFILYEAVALLLAIGGYLYIAIRRKMKWAWFMTSGLIISVTASAIQATGTTHLKLIWEFDHNGLFHLIQIAGLLLIFAGLSSRSGSIS